MDEDEYCAELLLGDPGVFLQGAFQVNSIAVFCSK